MCTIVRREAWETIAPEFAPVPPDLQINDRYRLEVWKY